MIVLKHTKFLYLNISYSVFCRIHPEERSIGHMSLDNSVLYTHLLEFHTSYQHIKPLRNASASTGFDIFDFAIGMR